MNIDLTPILQALIGILAAIITAKVIPWIKARTTVSQQILIDAAVKMAVMAAEQLYGAGTGAQKLEYAQTYLAGKGYTVDRAAIEAAVKELSTKITT